MRDEIQRVHKQYKREIVLYREPSAHPERATWTSRS
jgi:hypothetical protein